MFDIYNVESFHILNQINMVLSRNFTTLLSCIFSFLNCMSLKIYFMSSLRQLITTNIIQNKLSTNQIRHVCNDNDRES